MKMKEKKQQQLHFKKGPKFSVEKRLRHFPANRHPSHKFSRMVPEKVPVIIIIIFVARRSGREMSSRRRDAKNDN